MKRYIVERTSKAEIKPEKQSQKSVLKQQQQQQNKQTAEDKSRATLTPCVFDINTEGEIGLGQTTP